MRTWKTYISLRAVVALTALTALPLLLAGCAAYAGPDRANPSPQPASSVGPSGSVFGGQAPIAGATIQLYAIGTTGNKSAATPLISQALTSNAQGGWSITGTYTCPPNSLVYMVATGGNSGGGENNAIALMAALGPCRELAPSTYIVVNEVTTVAAAYALAPFMSGYENVGASASGMGGITNAFLTVNDLVYFALGIAPGPTLPHGATAPVAKLYTVANILSSCINSRTSSAACQTLFSDTTPAGGIAPVDTVGAALNIANAQGSNVDALFQLASSNPPFEPMLTVAPNDWTLALKFADPSLNSPYGLAIDGTGNVWVTNEGGGSVTELSGAGAVLSGTGGFTGGGLVGPKGIAIDKSGNAWIANAGGNSIVELSSAGKVLSGTGGFTAGGVAAPAALALDSQSNVWVANFGGNSVSLLSNTGTPSAASPITDSGAIVNPSGIAIDQYGYAWISAGGSNSVVLIQPNYGSFYFDSYTDNALQEAAGIAIDAGGTKWVAANGINAVSVISGFSGPASISPVRSKGLNFPTSIAVDGAGAVWMTNAAAAGSLAELSPSGVLVSPLTGFGGLNIPVGIGIDASGSVWTANIGDNSVSEFVGLATPVVTPLAANVGP